MLKNMKKPLLIGLICELVLAVLALACLVVAAVFGKVGLIIGSAIVMLALLYIAGGFLMEHFKPGTSYFNWVAWFWNVFCVQWVWQIFCKTWVWEILCKQWIWQSLCIDIVYNKFKKNDEEFSELNEDAPLLRVEHLSQHFGFGEYKTKAVDDVSFEIKKGEVFGLVGESGCGKTTTGRTIIKLYNATSGNVYYKGQRICAGTLSYFEKIKEAKKDASKKISAIVNDTKENPQNKEANDAKISAIKAERAEVVSYNRKQIQSAKHDQKHLDKDYARKLVKTLDSEYLPKLEEMKTSGASAEAIAELKKEYKEKRSKAKRTKLITQIQMIFQDPVASLDPRMTVREIISEGLIIQGEKNKKVIDEKVYEMLELVGLVREHAGRYPHEFSGGQKQRIGIARSIIMNPEMIIADEPVSALDVSIQAQVINLLNDLKERLGLTILFIAHDLSVVKYFSDRIGVMYFGKMVELATSEELFKHPLHPYTRSLLSAIPLPDPITEKTRQRITYNPLASHDYSVDKPYMREVAPGHLVYCNDKEFEEYQRILAE